MDVYVDDFVAAAQGKETQCQVRRLLLHAMDDVFWSLSLDDAPTWHKLVSLKNTSSW